MRPTFAIPSAWSVVPQSRYELQFHDSHGVAASVSFTTSPMVATLRMFFGPEPCVSRGDLLCPRWRRELATDLRLCYWPNKASRTPLLRCLTGIATAWDAHASLNGGEE